MRTRTKMLGIFLTEFAKNPLQIASVWPSSPALARSMASWLPANSDQTILELGPGTGVVTAELLAAGLKEEQLVAVEKSAALARSLKIRFPRARILSGDALEVAQLLEGEKVGAVFSSLPLKFFSAAQVKTLAEQIHEILAPDGHWVQFSYQLVNGHAPAPSFHAINSKIIWQNLPPAKVSVYRARSGVRGH